MFSVKIRIVILFIILSSGLLLQAEEVNSRFFFQHVSKSSGLSDAAVSSIAQDYRGFLWFGTLNGLNRYDGKKITHFEHDPYDRMSLPHNKIQTMVAYKHSLLIGTYNGLSIFNVDTEKFRNFSKIPGNKNSLSNNVVVAILPDTDGKIWIGTLQGLNRLDPSTGKCEIFFHDAHDSKSLHNNVIRSLYRDKDGRIWVGTYNGLDRYNRKNGTFTHFGITGKAQSLLPSKYVMSIKGGEGNTLWVGTWGGGLSLYNIATNTFVTYSLGDNRVYTINTDEKGKVWAGTWGGGLYIFDTVTGKSERYVNKQGNTQSLSNNIVYSIARDRSGMFWVGTKGGGVNKINLKKKNPLVLYHDKKNPASLTDGDIYSFCEDSKGYIWIGTDNGLDRWNRISGKIKHFRKETNCGLPENTVTVVMENSRKQLLVGTLKGIYVYHYASERFLPLKTPEGKDLSFKNQRIYAIYENHAHTLWIGTYDNGCYMIEEKTGKVEHYLHDVNVKGSLSDNLVTSFLETDEGLWVGTNNGLNRYRSGAKTFVHYYLNPDDRTSISSNSIRTLYLDSKKRMWIGTEGGGLDLYNEKQNNFTHYLSRNGLSGNRVQGILEDNSGRIWCATKKGISILSPRTGRIILLDESDGLPDSNLNYGVLKSKDGYLYFSSRKGITRFSGTVRRHCSCNPPLYVTDILTMGKKVIPIKIKTDTSVIVIPYRQNSVTFHYICLDYTDPQENEYSYFLDGFDDSWKSVGNRTAALYAGIPAGTYTFKVKASIDDGKWIGKVASVRIRIEPPFWRSWWAQIIYDLLIVLVLYVIIKMKHHYRLKKKLAELEFLRNELQESNRVLKVISTKDALTGLFNRRELDARLLMEVQRARRFNEPLSVLMVDIDFFKDFNDRYGRQEGDACLIRIARILTDCLPRELDFVARYGGEEFCIILPNCSLKTAKETGEKIKRAVQKKRIEHKKTGLGGILTVSIGVTSGILPENEGPEILLKTADEALHAAKHEGRNKVVSKEIPSLSH